MDSGRGSYRILNGIAATAAIVTIAAFASLMFRDRRKSYGGPFPPELMRVRDESRLAQTAEREGRYVDAEAHLRKALAERPNSLRLRLETARFYSDRHRYAEAVALYGPIFGAQSGPDSPEHNDLDARLRYGEACLALGLTAPAREAFQRTCSNALFGTQGSSVPTFVGRNLTLSQQHAHACVRVAWSLQPGNERRASLSQRAIEIDPQCWEAYRLRVADLWDAGIRRRDRAPALRELDRFHRATTVPTNDATGLVVYANTLFDQGQRRRAVAELTTMFYKAKDNERNVIRSGIAQLELRTVNTFFSDRDSRVKAITYLKDCLDKPGVTDARLLENALARYEQDRDLASQASGMRPMSGGLLGFSIPPPGHFDKTGEPSLLRDI